MFYWFICLPFYKRKDFLSLLFTAGSPAPRTVPGTGQILSKSPDRDPALPLVAALQSEWFALSNQPGAHSVPGHVHSQQGSG